MTAEDASVPATPGEDRLAAPPGAELASSLEAIVASSDDAIVGMTLDGTITTWNAGATAMYGYAPGEMIGHNVSELVTADRAGELTPYLARLSLGERTDHFETTRVRKDGTRIDVSVSMSPIRDANGAVVGAAAVGRDISARIRAEASSRLMEARLRQSERMETVGQLAGGLAHDVNNVLGVILGYVSLLADEVGENLEAHAEIRRIEGAVQRAARLTRQLLIFSRRDTAQPQDLDLNQVISDVRDLLAASLGGGVELRFDPPEGLPPIRADRGHVEQVLLNLAANARDAMPAGGVLTIGTGVADLDEAFCAAHPGAVAGRRVELSVADTGTGMSAEVLARIFEPFFTTKPIQQGTGLGLSTVYGIATRAGGSISVESKEGSGSVFRVFFPLATASSLAPGGAPALQRILVVDDMPEMLAIVSRILRGDGYAVIEARSDEEALWLALRDPGLDLVIADSLRPQAPGAELVAKLSETTPGLPVLSMSSGVHAGTDAEYLSRQGIAVIEKPFTASALLAKVRSLLAAPPGQAPAPAP